MLPYTSNTSATGVRHECNTTATQLRREWDTSNTSATQKQHKCYTNDTNVTRVLHEHTSVKRVKNFDFDNHTRKNIASHPYIYYMASGRLKGEEQFHSKNYFLEMSLFHVKIGLKSAQQQLNFLMEKTSAKSFTLDCSYKCPCTFPHSYQQ